MKIIRILLIAALCAATMLCACSCGGNKELAEHKAAQTQKAAGKQKVEPSENVNGMRFNTTLYKFTERYNFVKRVIGENDLIIEGNWRAMGSPTRDNKGMQIQYYYYDDYNVNITATVEVESQKIVNIGCGTTLGQYLAQEEDRNNSEAVLRKMAMIAHAVCQYENTSIDKLQDIFYTTTTGKENALWYDGYVFSQTTQQDKDDSRNGLILFRIFPVTDELKEEWKLPEYTGSTKNES